MGFFSPLEWQDANLRLTHDSTTHKETVPPHRDGGKKNCTFFKTDVFGLQKTHINHTSASKHRKEQLY